MASSVPVVNLGLKYINGLLLSHTNGAIIGVSKGQCRDSLNVNDIVLESGVAPNIASNGVNGLDIGSVAINTFYAIYVIADTTEFNPTAVVYSTDVAQPLLPSGYDIFRRIGWVKTNATPDILGFRQRGASVDRWMWYDTAISTDISAGNSAVFAAVDLSAGIPDLVTEGGDVKILCSFTPTAGNDTLELRPGSSNAPNGYVRLSGSVAGIVKTSTMQLPWDINTGIQYLVTGTGASLSVEAYMDQLI